MSAPNEEKGGGVPESVQTGSQARQDAIKRLSPESLKNLPNPARVYITAMIAAMPHHQKMAMMSLIEHFPEALTGKGVRFDDLLRVTSSNRKQFSRAIKQLVARGFIRKRQDRKRGKSLYFNRQQHAMGHPKRQNGQNHPQNHPEKDPTQYIDREGKKSTDENTDTQTETKDGNRTEQAREQDTPPSRRPLPPHEAEGAAAGRRPPDEQAHAPSRLGLNANTPQDVDAAFATMQQAYPRREDNIHKYHQAHTHLIKILKNTADERKPETLDTILTGICLYHHQTDNDPNHEAKYTFPMGTFFEKRLWQDMLAAYPTRTERAAAIAAIIGDEK